MRPYHCSARVSLGLVLVLQAGCTEEPDDHPDITWPATPASPGDDDGGDDAPTTGNHASTTSNDAPTTGNHASTAPDDEGGTTTDGPNDPSGDDSSGAETNGPAPECTPADTTCDGDKLQTCVQGEFETTLCSQAWCAEQGLGNSLGCGYDDGVPGCKCEDPLECFDGEGQCVGIDQARECVDGTWSEPLSCDKFCEQNGYDLSLSCTQVAKTAVCDCRFACQPGVDLYACSQDGTGIFACEGSGTWSPYNDCNDVCQELGYSGSIGCQWFTEYDQFACNCY